MVVVAAVLLLGLLAWHGRWFATEPVVRGRTVTEWLDSMALFDEMRRRDETGQHSFHFVRSPEVLAGDPALTALVSLGSNAVPVLRQRITEPPSATAVERWRQWLGWSWERIRSSPPIPRPASPAYALPRDEARRSAAALALLALGTNQQAGLDVLMEASLTGSNQFTYTSDGSLDTLVVLRMANPGLPHRHAEMVAGLERLLAHPDPAHRRAAANDTRAFPEEKPRWQPVLFRLATQDPDTDVRRNALWALAAQGKPDLEVLSLCARTLADPVNPNRLRAFAAAGLGSGGASATNYLPLLKATLREKDSPLQREARSAIRRIEHPRHDY